MTRIKGFESLSIPDPNVFEPLAVHIRQESQMADRDLEFLRQAADLVGLAVDEEQGWLDSIVEKTLSRRWSREVLLISIFQHSAQALAD